MFRFNPGKEQKIFNDYNPYTIRGCGDCLGKIELAAQIPANEMCRGCKVIREMELDRKKRITTNKAEYERLKIDPDYNNVEFNPANGGLMATHKDHNFDHQKGWYEKNVQRVGFNKGNSVIFGSEAGQPDGVKYTDGLWNGKKAEIRGAETGKPENIRNALKHGAKKRETEVAIIYFPKNNFDKDAFYSGLRAYEGLAGLPGRQYKAFERIICIQGDDIVLDIKYESPTSSR